MPGAGKSDASGAAARAAQLRSSPLRRLPTTSSRRDSACSIRDDLRDRGRGRLPRPRGSGASPSSLRRDRHRARHRRRRGAARGQPRARCTRARTVVYLRSTPEELCRRLRHDTQRPLLQVRRSAAHAARAVPRARPALPRDGPLRHRDRAAVGADAGQHDPDAARAGRRDRPGAVPSPRATAAARALAARRAPVHFARMHPRTPTRVADRRSASAATTS